MNSGDIEGFMLMLQNKDYENIKNAIDKGYFNVNEWYEVHSRKYNIIQILNIGKDDLL